MLSHTKLFLSLRGIIITFTISPFLHETNWILRPIHAAAAKPSFSSCGFTLFWVEAASPFFFSFLCHCGEPWREGSGEPWREGRNDGWGREGNWQSGHGVGEKERMGAAVMPSSFPSLNHHHFFFSANAPKPNPGPFPKRTPLSSLHKSHHFSPSSLCYSAILSSSSSSILTLQSSFQFGSAAPDGIGQGILALISWWNFCATRPFPHRIQRHKFKCLF